MAPALALALATGALTLEWEAPDGCPPREAVLESVQQWLGSDPSASKVPLTARGRITAQGDRFRLELETHLGRRQLEAKGCAELSQAGAVVLALLMDPAVAPAPRAEAAPAAPEAPPPEPTPNRVHLRVAGVGDLGSLPAVAAGWHAALGLERGALRVEVFAGSYAPQRVAVQGARAAVLSLDFDVGVRPCFVFAGNRVRPQACAALALGRATGNGDGIANPGGGRTLFAAAFVGLGARVDLWWRFALTLELEGGVPLARTRWAFDDVSGAVYQTPIFIGRGELGVEARLW